MAAIELSDFIRQERARTDKFEYDYNYMTVEEYADHIGKTANTVRRYIKEGRLETMTVGAKRLVKIRKDENSEKLLEENRQLREENAALRERFAIIRQLLDTKTKEAVL